MINLELKVKEARRGETQCQTQTTIKHTKKGVHICSLADSLCLLHGLSAEDSTTIIYFREVVDELT